MEVQYGMAYKEKGFHQGVGRGGVKTLPKSRPLFFASFRCSELPCCCSLVRSTGWQV